MKFNRNRDLATTTTYATHRTSVLAQERGFQFNTLSEATFWDKNGRITSIPTNLQNDDEIKRFMTEQAGVEKFELVTPAPTLENLQQWLEWGHNMVIESNYVKTKKVDANGNITNQFRGRVILSPDNKGNFEFAGVTARFNTRPEALDAACCTALEQMERLEQGENDQFEQQHRTASFRHTHGNRTSTDVELTTDMQTVIGNNETSKTEKITRLRELGMGVKQIANTLKVPYSFAYSATHRANINRETTVEQ